MIKNRYFISLILIFFCLAAAIIWGGVTNKVKDMFVIDMIEIENRNGEILKLNTSETKELLNALGDIPSVKTDRLKTLFKNKVSFYDNNKKIFTLYTGSPEFFNKKNSQVSMGLFKKAYSVNYMFYQKLDEVANKHGFNLATD